MAINVILIMENVAAAMAMATVAISSNVISN
jgi:hypothetical protein